MTRGLDDFLKESNSKLKLKLKLMQLPHVADDGIVCLPCAITS